jgi:hypothetical protein
LFEAERKFSHQLVSSGIITWQFFLSFLEAMLQWAIFYLEQTLQDFQPSAGVCVFHIRLAHVLKIFVAFVLIRIQIFG